MNYQSSCLISLLFSVLLLSGCGGGGGGDDSSPTQSSGSNYLGSTAEATINASNAKDLSTAAASGAQQALVSEAVSDGFAPRPQAVPSTKLTELAPRIAQWINQLRSPTAAKTTNLSADICDAGGRAIADTNDAETEGNITFSNCAMSDMNGGTLVMDGTVAFNMNTGADSLRMVFRMTVTYIGVQQAINLTLACSSITTATPTCSVTSDFVGIDSRVYRIGDTSVSGNDVSGYNISLALYDPDHGRVDMSTTQPITFNCPTAVPGSGMVTLNGTSGTSATVSFDSCSSYTVTVDGVGTTYDW